MRRLVAAALGASLFASSGYCHAEPVRVSYAAPPECPQRSDFLERVNAHTQRLELAEPGSLARVLDVWVLKSGKGYGARLEFVDAHRQRVVRQIDGASCGEVTDALALAVALLVEAEPLDPPANEPKPNESPLAPSEAVESPPPRLPGPLATRWVPPSPKLREAIWSLSFSGRASSQLAPDPAYGVAFGVSRYRSWDPQRGDLANGWRVAVDGSYLDSGPVSFERTSVRFRMLGVRGSLCGALVLRSPVFAELCAGGEAGYWRASAERSARLTEPRSGSEGWAALGLPVTFGVSLEQLQLFFSGGPWFPLTRGRFTFSSPHSVVHEVRPVSVSLDLGLRLAL